MLTASMRMLARPICIAILITGSLLANGQPAIAYEDNYPAIWKSKPLGAMFDTWKHSTRYCTSWVSWALHDRNGFEMPFHGHAFEWGAKARGRGYRVDNTPATGAVAWWNENHADGFGHVAYVESLTRDESGHVTRVTISEYNTPAGSGAYNARTINASSPSGYIHFKDLGGDVPASSGGQGSGVGPTGTYKGSDRLVVDQPLYQNQYIMSPDGLFVLMLQADGNLVLYGPGYHPIWASNTAGSGAGYAVLQPDGNLVLYTPDGKQAVWGNGRIGSGGSYIVLQSDGNLVEYDADHHPVWGSGTQHIGHIPPAYKGGSHLAVNQGLYQNQYIRSADGRYFVLMQRDGSLVVHGPGYHVIGGIGPAGTGAGYAVLQPDSNLVLYMPNGKQAVWGNAKMGSWGSYMVIQNDGNFVEYTSDHQPVWGSGTAGKI